MSLHMREPTAPPSTSIPETAAAHHPEAAIAQPEMVSQQGSRVLEYVRQVRDRVSSRAALAAGLAVSSALGTAAPSHELPTPEPPAITVSLDALPDRPLPEHTVVCPLTNVEVFQAVRVALLGNPETNTPPLTARQDPFPFMDTNEAEVPTYAIKGGLSDSDILRYKLAKKYGLTLHSAAPYNAAIEKVSGDPKSTEAEKFNAAFTQTQAYLSKFGVSLEIGKEKEDLVGNARTPTWAELENPRTYGNIKTLLYTFAQYPQEYVDLSGVERIMLVHGPKDIAGYYSGGRIALNMQYVLGESTVHHEMEHGGDEQTCGDAAMQDPSWVGRNKGISYGPDTEHSYEQFYDQLKTMAKNAEQANPGSADDLMSCTPPAAVREIGAKVAFATEYGGTNPVEDKAELAEIANRPDRLPEVIWSALPIMREKLVAYFARIAQYRPRLALFFIAQRFPHYCDIESNSVKLELYLQQPSQK